MNAARIFTRRRMGMDYRVWIIMLLTGFLSLGLLGYKKLTDRPCLPATITVNQKSIKGQAIGYLGKMIFFQLHTQSKADIIWNFDDGSIKGKDKVITHEFKKEGIYNVAAVVDGNCLFEQEVRIIRPLIDEPDKTVVEMFWKPGKPKAGDKVDISASANTAITSYEWRLLNSSSPAQKDSEASFRFDKPGLYKVQLMINNDPSSVITNNIQVEMLTPDVTTVPGNEVSDFQFPPIEQFNKPNEKPVNGGANQQQSQPPPTSTDKKQDTTIDERPIQPEAVKPAAPEKPKPIAIDKETFKGLLQEVIDGNTDIEELYAFLDHSKTTKVEVNGKMPLVNLPRFCNDMRNKKNNKISSLDFVRDDQNRIQTIKVVIQEKKKFIDKFKPWKKKS